MTPITFFITGTDTDVGKTAVTAALCLRWQADYWKPIQSGTPTDFDTVSSLIGNSLVAGQILHPSQYTLSQPLSPHEAARRDGVTVRLSDLVLPRRDHTRPLLIEGAGGALVPVNGCENTPSPPEMVIDMATHFQIPAIVVTRSGLGTINHTLLTLEALRARRIAILGVIMNGVPSPHNREALTEFGGGVRILAELPKLDVLNADTIQPLADCLPLLQDIYKCSVHSNPTASSSRGARDP